MPFYITNALYFGHCYGHIFFPSEGHFKIHVKIRNSWNLAFLAAGGSRRSGLILFSLAPSYLISALSLPLF